MSEAYIVDAVRTPVGRRGGGFVATHPLDLAAHVIRTLAFEFMQQGSHQAGSPIEAVDRDNLSEFSTDWSGATAELLGDAVPWRNFRWCHGQKYYVGDVLVRNRRRTSHLRIAVGANASRDLNLS